MKERKTGILSGFFLGGLLLLLLLRPAASMDGAKEGLLLFGGTVLPSILPFFVLTSLLSQSGMLALAGGLSFLPKWLCRARGSLGWAMVLCFIAGAPTSARLLAALHEEGAIGEGEMLRLSACCTLTGPLFLIGAGGALLGGPAFGAAVCCAQFVAGLLNALLWRGVGQEPEIGQAPMKKEGLSPFDALPNALQSSCSAAVLVGGAIIVFSALRALLQESGLFFAIETVLSGLLPETAAGALLSGFMEVSIGIRDAALSAVSLPMRLSLAAGIASFGGFSIFCQSACFLKGLLPLKLLFLQRLSHGALGFVLMRAALFFLSPSLPAMALPAPPMQPEPGLALAALGLSFLFGLGLLWLAPRKRGA
ncbi:MAG: hypothetical protein LBU47_06595 [Christensenellaceae bacterium]|jgi:hypothetical protein|nr:hypothetical protein [Christensenellaceae bacterium]